MLYEVIIIKEIEDIDYFKVVDVSINGSNHRLHLKYDIEKLMERDNVKPPLVLKREITLDLGIVVRKANKMFVHKKTMPESTWPYGLFMGVVRKVDTYTGTYCVLNSERKIYLASYVAQIDCGDLVLDADLRRKKVKVGDWLMIDGVLEAKGIEEIEQ